MRWEPRSEKSLGSQSIAPNPTDRPEPEKPTPGEEFANLISALRKEQPALSYPDAARMIGDANPDLLRHLYPTAPKGAKAPDEWATDSQKAAWEFSERVAKLQRAEPGLDFAQAMLRVGRADPALIGRMY